MVSKDLPFNKEDILKIIKNYPTPFHIYDEKAILENARKMKAAFREVPGFKEFFAVKALPNPFILKILKHEGFGADCSSLPELILAEKAGITGEDIMFSSNDTPLEEFVKAKELGAYINLDDISHIDYLEKYDRMKIAITEKFDMPEHLVDLLITFLQQNNGKLSNRARQKEQG